MWDDLEKVQFSYDMHYTQHLERMQNGGWSAVMGIDENGNLGYVRNAISTRHQRERFDPKHDKSFYRHLLPDDYDVWAKHVWGEAA